MFRQSFAKWSNLDIFSSFILNIYILFCHLYFHRMVFFPGTPGKLSGMANCHGVCSTVVVTCICLWIPIWQVVRRFWLTGVVTPKFPGIRVPPKLSGADNFPGGRFLFKLSSSIPCFPLIDSFPPSIGGLLCQFVGHSHFFKIFKFKEWYVILFTTLPSPVHSRSPRKEVTFYLFTKIGPFPEMT